MCWFLFPLSISSIIVLYFCIIFKLILNKLNNVYYFVYTTYFFFSLYFQMKLLCLFFIFANFIFTFNCFIYFHICNHIYVCACTYIYIYVWFLCLISSNTHSRNAYCNSIQYEIFIDNLRILYFRINDFLCLFMYIRSLCSVFETQPLFSNINRLSIIFFQFLEFFVHFFLYQKKSFQYSLWKIFVAHF